jgi:hypothetical protein
MAIGMLWFIGWHLRRGYEKCHLLFDGLKAIGKGQECRLEDCQFFLDGFATVLQSMERCCVMTMQDRNLLVQPIHDILAGGPLDVQPEGFYHHS